VALQWTAPGDDGSIGTATSYEMRMATLPITSGNWAMANVVGGLPAPMVSGTRQSVIVRDLSRDTTYFFAIRAQDDNGNLAPISNVVRWDWVFDTAPPAAPTGLSGVKAGASVQLNWDANSEPDLLGYSVYRATAAGGPFTKITGSLVTATNYLDSSIPAGTTEVWYEVSASDVNGNESAMSAAFHLTLSTPSAPVVTSGLSPGYPNPSHAGQPVCVPFTLDGPASGAFVDIVNAGGFRVRRLDVSAAPRCADGSLRWDGRNDGGLEVAPGVYRAWLIEGDRRTGIKLVRQP
jgi:hypothetical protein